MATGSSGVLLLLLPVRGARGDQRTTLAMGFLREGGGVQGEYRV